MYPSWVKVGQRVKCLYHCAVKHQLGTIKQVYDCSYTVDFDDIYFNDGAYSDWKFSSGFEPISSDPIEEAIRTEKMKRQLHADKYL